MTDIVFVVPADGSAYTEDRPDDVDWLRFLYKTIGCTIVQETHCDMGIRVMMDEEGGPQYKPSARINLPASLLARRIGGMGHRFFGTVVFIGYESNADDEEEFAGLRPGQLEILRNVAAELEAADLGRIYRQ